MSNFRWSYIVLLLPFILTSCFLTEDGKVEFSGYSLNSKVPKPSISSSYTTATNENPMVFDLEFNASVSGLEESDFDVTNGSVTSLSGSGTQFTLSVTPSSEGTVTIELPKGAAKNENGEPSESLSFSGVSYDALLQQSQALYLFTPPPVHQLLRPHLSSKSRA